MLLGQQLNTYAPGIHGNHWDSTLAVARAGEQAGLDSIWLADHFMFPDRQNPAKEIPVFECFVALGAIAAATSRIRIGELVVGIPYRNPALLAKMLTTLDIIAHGRTIIGIGAAWHEPEFVAYGWPFPSVRTRMEMMEEAVQIIDLMLTQRPASFAGTHYTIENAYNDPMPVQQPRPPIMIGGDGERHTLRIAAQYADFCNVFGDPETVAHKFAVLRRHCETVGRPVDAVTRSNHISLLIAANEQELTAKKARYGDDFDLIGTPNEVIEGLRRYAEVGSQYVTFTVPDAADLEPILLLGETVVPVVAAF
ncbi:MAG TPA: LLM class F420-dependent oxidoreductase [Roseiflexaceae bacterium]|nr:LLM class F420-dependent oxidoreductase [Roseiflexaceae bacterium]HMP41150.1 LLM class F420-dependent oxidoreductase [Roseiflexaceae bacterium]